MSDLSSRVTDGLAAVGSRLLHTRWLVRAPIWLYRARLGVLCGPRLLMLEHVGRVSGARRYVVLEIIGRPTPGSYVVVSGFGTRSQWFRNIQADPHVRVSHGSRRPADATATTLDAAEASAALRDYATAHPRSWRALQPVLESILDEQIETTGTTLPLVLLDTAATP